MRFSRRSFYALDFLVTYSLLVHHVCWPKWTGSQRSGNWLSPSCVVFFVAPMDRMLNFLRLNWDYTVRAGFHTALPFLPQFPHTLWISKPRKKHRTGPGPTAQASRFGPVAQESLFALDLCPNPKLPKPRYSECFWSRQLIERLHAEVISEHTCGRRNQTLASC